MNWVDISIVLIFLLAVLIGWYRGFIRGSLDLLAWAGSFILAYVFYPYMAKGLGNFFDLGVWLLPVAFLSTALLARILMSFITGYITRFIPEGTDQNPINKFLG